MRYSLIFLALASCSPFEMPKPEQKCIIIGMDRNDEGIVTAFRVRCEGSDKVFKTKPCITDEDCERFDTE